MVAYQLANKERSEALRLLRLDFHGVDGGVGWSGSAPGNSSIDEISRTLEDRFDTSVGKVAYPTRDSEALRLVLSRTAEPDSLDAS